MASCRDSLSVMESQEDGAKVTDQKDVIERTKEKGVPGIMQSPGRGRHVHYDGEGGRRSWWWFWPAGRQAGRKLPGNQLD